MKANTSALIAKLFEIGAIKFGNFVLKSGATSPIYIDLRMIIAYPSLLKKISEMIWEKIKPLSFNLVCGVPYTALPLATAISLTHNIPMLMKRKEAKDYGTKKMIEGIYKEDDRCVIIEDVITSGMSILETIDALKEEKLDIRDIVVVVNREEGGKERLEALGFNVYPLISMKDIFGYHATR